MPTKIYVRKNNKTRKNRRGGGKSSKISMKSMSKSMKDLFGEEMMKATPSRKQPSRAVKEEMASLRQAVEKELAVKTATATAKKEKKAEFNKKMNEIADLLERL
jgi:hypothetical protein